MSWCSINKKLPCGLFVLNVEKKIQFIIYILCDWIEMSFIFTNGSIFFQWLVLATNKLLVIVTTIINIYREKERFYGLVTDDMYKSNWITDPYVYENVSE